MTRPQIFARLHVCENGSHHLRARQPTLQQFNDGLKEAMKNVGTPSEWKPGEWEWDYPLTPNAVSALADVAEQFDIELVFDDHLRNFAESKIKQDRYEITVRKAVEQLIKEPSLPVEAIITNTVGGTKPPMRHQSIGAAWGMRVRALFLAWDPGLGKTRTATDISGIAYRHRQIRMMEHFWLSRRMKWVAATVCPVTGIEKKPAKWVVERHERWAVRGGVLVICPKSIIPNWVRELYLWQGMTGVGITGGAGKKRLRAGTKAHVHVCSYGSLHHVIDNEYDMVICDEVHRCANNTQQMNNVLELSLKASKRVVLSGTPVNGKLESVFYPMYICDHGRALGASKTAFLQRYFNQVGDKRYGKYEPRANALQEISAAMASCTYFLRKEECLDLPPKTQVVHWVEMTTSQIKYYNQLKEEAVAFIQDSEVTVEQTVQKIMKLRQLCQGVVKTDDGEWKRFNHAKIEELQNLLFNQLYGRKVVIWCDFKEEIQAVCDFLSHYGIGHVRLDGTVQSEKKRQAVFDSWNYNPDIKAFVVQLQISEGYTILANECQVPCYDAVYLAVPWSYVHWKQSQDRIHRIGQHYPTTYRYILTTNGLDRNIYAELSTKQEVADETHEYGKDHYIKLLTDDVPGLSELTEGLEIS